MPNPVANIFLDRLESNVRFIHKKSGNKKILAVVKANAYGHGLTEIVKALDKTDVHGFCVSSENELIDILKTKTKKPVLMLSRFDKKHADLLKSNQVRLSIHNIDDIKWIVKIAQKLKIIIQVHVKIDTGMSRLGINPDDLNKVIHEVKRYNCINIEGVWTHMSSADSDEKFTRDQLKIFNKCMSNFAESGVKPIYIHTANSAAIMRFPESHFNTVRPGLLLYGVSPLLKSVKGLRPIMEFSAPLVLKKNIKKGISVGYNRQFQSEKETVIGTIQAGYADGIPSCMNNNGQVSIKKKMYPICGNISMDMTTIDLGLNLQSDSEMCYFWGVPPLYIESLAQKYKKLPYEFLVSLSSRVKRVYYD